MAPVLLAVLLVLALAPPAAAAPGGVVLSELRFRGPNGGNDELVELRNATEAPVDVSGWQLRGCNAVGTIGVRATVPPGTVLPGGASFLLANTAAGGYSGPARPDLAYSTGITDDGGALLVDDGGAVQDRVGATSAPAQCREGAGVARVTVNEPGSYERNGGTQDTDDNAADLARRAVADPQACGEACTAPPPPPAATPIHAVQGAGASSPLVGREVTIEGVVTGIDDEIGRSTSGRTFPEDAGVFVQEERPDADPDTSEGIFVGFVRNRVGLTGKRVRIAGVVREKFGFTMIEELRDREPEVLGAAPLPEPAALALPYERLEGMRVRLAEGTASSGGTNKFGELFLRPGDRPQRVLRTDAAPDLVATDADAGAGDPANPARPERPSTTLVSADLFDRVRDVVGPLAFAFGNFRIMVQPGALPTLVEGPVPYPFPGPAPAARHEVRIASFNVENFFSVGAELDGAPVGAEEHAEKRDRIADAIDRLLGRPDVVAVQEVDTLATLRGLAERLGGYTALLEEGNDERGIDVGFLVADTVGVTAVRQLGADAAGPAGVRCSDVPGRLFDRPPLAVDLVARPGLRLTAISNHFSSKSAPDACREAQAAFVRDRVAEIEAVGGEALVTGDLNAFEDEGALAVLQDGRTSLTNLWALEEPAERYSFAFQGRLQTLDHVLVTDGLRRRVRSFGYEHFDNDYADRGAAGGGHKVSDHDPPLVGLEARPGLGLGPALGG